MLECDGDVGLAILVCDMGMCKRGSLQDSGRTEPGEQGEFVRNQKSAARSKSGKGGVLRFLTKVGECKPIEKMHRTRMQECLFMCRISIHCQCSVHSAQSLHLAVCVPELLSGAHALRET